jgi:hypothetical protein
VRKIEKKIERKKGKEREEKGRKGKNKLWEQVVPSNSGKQAQTGP